MRAREHSSVKFNTKLKLRRRKRRKHVEMLPSEPEPGLLTASEASLPPNDAHLPRDSSVAPCHASVQSTRQAAFTDSHCTSRDLILMISFRLQPSCVWSLGLHSYWAQMMPGQKWDCPSLTPTVVCIMKFNNSCEAHLQAPNMDVEQVYVLECHTNTQPTVFVTFALFSVALHGKCTLVSCSHAHIHGRLKQSTINSRTSSNNTLIFVHSKI